MAKLSTEGINKVGFPEETTDIFHLPGTYGMHNVGKHGSIFISLALDRMFHDRSSSGAPVFARAIFQIFKSPALLLTIDPTVFTEWPSLEDPSL